MISKSSKPIPHIASVALPAAGAYLGAAATVAGGGPAYATGPFVLSGATELSFVLAYAASSATGAPAAYLEWDTTTTPHRETMVDPTLMPVGSNTEAEQSVYDLVYCFPPRGSAGAITYHLAVDVPPGKTTARLVVKERGDTANPGTVAVTVAARRVS